MSEQGTGSAYTAGDPKDKQEKDENLFNDVEEHLRQFNIPDDEIEKEYWAIQDALDAAKKKHEPKQAVGVIYIPTCKFIFVAHTLSPSDFMRQSKAMADAKAKNMSVSVATFVQSTLDYPRYNVGELKEGTKDLLGGHILALVTQISRFNGYSDEGEIKNY